MMSMERVELYETRHRMSRVRLKNIRFKTKYNPVYFVCMNLQGSPIFWEGKFPDMRASPSFIDQLKVL